MVTLSSLGAVEGRLGSVHSSSNNDNVEPTGINEDNMPTDEEYQHHRHLTGSQTLQTCWEDGGSGCWGDGTHVVTNWHQCASCWKSGQWNQADCATAWPSRGGIIVYCGFDPVLGRVNFDLNGFGSTSVIGGDGGSAFDFRNQMPSASQFASGSVRLRRFRINYGAYIDSITTTYSNNAQVKVGGSGGSHYVALDLTDNEYIQYGQICTEHVCFQANRRGTCLDSGDVVTRLILSTNKGRTRQVGRDNVGQTCRDINVGQDSHQVVGFHGRSGRFIDALGTVTVPIP